jgi:hypothetical protein
MLLLAFTGDLVAGDDFGDDSCAKRFDIDPGAAILPPARCHLVVM